MAGYIRKVEKGRDGRVHTLSDLGLRLAQDLAPMKYQEDIYICISTRGMSLVKRYKKVLGQHMK